jgi:DNA processing protein
MGLKTEQIVKILQLERLGRRTALKICDLAKDTYLANDFDLQEFILKCITGKLVQRLPYYTNTEFNKAFQQGQSIMEKSDRAGVTVLSIFDNDFPQSLKEIQDKPLILNMRGNYKILNSINGVAIIGTRDPTDEGIKTGKFFGRYFGENGFNVVSGLAKGCDSAGHRGCLDGNGVTTAIVAHGLHTIYPKENEKLAKEIVDNNGVLLSEYFIGVGALANYFVERDRLQAGLSKGTIVIQTGIKGGTMHAVNATLDSEKPLAAVKYKTFISSDKVAGNDMLIKERKAFALTSETLTDFVKLLSPGRQLPPITSEMDLKTPIEYKKNNLLQKDKIKESKLEAFNAGEGVDIEPADEVYEDPKDDIYIQTDSSDFTDPKPQIEKAKPSGKRIGIKKPRITKEVKKKDNRELNL